THSLLRRTGLVGDLTSVEETVESDSERGDYTSSNPKLTLSYPNVYFDRHHYDLFYTKLHFIISEVNFAISEVSAWTDNVNFWTSEATLYHIRSYTS
ncbi:hypothetical protein Taro_033726, partial [Colocasia esculenta]|nr:hypothetical protein [Colocasia esculenta]